MEELGLLVEERAVVLVAFDDELVAFAVAPALAEIDGHSADKKPGIATGFDEYVPEKGGRRGLTVGADHHEGVLFGEKLVAQKAGERHQRELEALCLHDLDVILGADVADHYRIGSPGQVLRRKSFENRYFERFELIAHGRVQGLVGPAHLVSGGSQKPGEGSHTGAADSDQMVLQSAGRLLADPCQVKRVCVQIQPFANLFDKLALVTTRVGSRERKR